MRFADTVETCDRREQGIQIKPLGRFLILGAAENDGNTRDFSINRTLGRRFILDDLCVDRCKQL